MHAAIETQGLTRRHGSWLAVDDVSMTVPRHGIYGFLGRNGAGKTTTLKMLLGLWHADAGSICINDIDVRTHRIDAAREIGALLEPQGFHGNLSGRDNLDLSRRLIGCAASDIDRVLGVVDMREHARRPVAEYSLGMRQRLGLARAMLGAPSVLILDEPANGLDPEGIADMRRLLRALPERTGATVLLSSHQLGEIEHTATHVGTLSAGKLVLEGALSALTASLVTEIVAQVDDLPHAAAVALAHGFAVEATATELIIRLDVADDPRQAAAALVRAFCDGAIALHALAPRKASLERLYRQATAVAGPSEVEP